MLIRNLITVVIFMAFSSPLYALQCLGKLDPTTNAGPVYKVMSTEVGLLVGTEAGETV